MKSSDIIIIGAGASGLMAAKELATAGKKVIILEARDRVGGRIWPLDQKQFDYPAQGGPNSYMDLHHSLEPLQNQQTFRLFLQMTEKYGVREVDH